MTEREKMLAGELYDCSDPELLTRWHRAKDLVREYNQTDSGDALLKERILEQLLGGKGKTSGSPRPFTWTTAIPAGWQGKINNLPRKKSSV